MPGSDFTDIFNMFISTNCHQISPLTVSQVFQQVSKFLTTNGNLRNDKIDSISVTDPHGDVSDSIRNPANFKGTLRALGTDNAPFAKFPCERQNLISPNPDLEPSFTFS